MRNEKNMNGESGIGFGRGDVLPVVCAAAAGVLLLVVGFLLGLEARGEDAEVTKDTLFGDVDGTKTTVTDAVQDSWGAGKKVIIGEGARAYDGGKIAIGRDAKAYGRVGTSNSCDIAIGDNARANSSVGANWDAGALAIGDNAKANGAHAVAVGPSSDAYWYSSVAIGPFAYARYGGTAIGHGSIASEYDAVAIGIGGGSQKTFGARNYRAVAIGNQVIAKGEDAVALGPYSDALSDYAVAIGRSAKVPDNCKNGIAVGHYCRAGATNSTAIGQFCNTLCEGSIGLGRSSDVNGYGSIGIGQYARVDSKNVCCSNSIAFGHCANVSNANAMAFGFNSVTSGKNSTAIGPNALVKEDNAIGFSYSPDKFYFNSYSGKKSGDPAARSLQEYLDGCRQYQFSTPEFVDIWHLFEEYSEEYDTWFTAEYTTPNGVTCADGYIYDVAVTNGAEGVYFTLPEYASHSQDFIVRLACSDTNGTQIAGWGSYGASAPAEIDWPNGDLMTTGSLKGTNYVTFTQTGANRWRISCYPANKEK